MFCDSCGSFKPSQGLQQGCPLSPYLFVLCIGRVAHSIKLVVQSGRWNGFRMGRRGPQLSHLFFADDLILFSEASLLHVGVIQDTLGSFCAASGKTISNVKSTIFFSLNVLPETRDCIATNLNFSVVTDMGKYFGVPIVHSRVSKNTYVPLVEKVIGTEDFDDDVVKRFAAILPPSPYAKEDKLVWGLSKDGRFSIKSALSFLKGNISHSVNPFWQVIWSWASPERIRTFLWLSYHGRILTNVQQVHRRMSSDPSCALCGEAREDNFHTLRDCPNAKQVWLGPVPQCLWSVFFSGDIRTRIEANLSGTFGRENCDWHLVFGVAIWYIWKWQNECIFAGLDIPSTPIALIMKRVSNFVQAASLSRSTVLGPCSDEIQISWSPPLVNWVKLNTDGSVIADSSSAVGLQLAWQFGFRQLVAEVDNMATVNAILGTSSDLSHHGHLADSIRDLLAKDWRVQLRHNYREANVCADHLAHMAHFLP
ncbi:hypothetical protein GH714_030483 [Hevea brasiliensis]|uniref:Reverse transcriptase domain-containing protein n=1 Tax=Hevea brasiliensis TaxID=3981 RepID=A0A6A6KD55_HEVBR|nr:hypothetical protein GH714_030483 [Hevea brasiliensis]